MAHLPRPVTINCCISSASRKVFVGSVTIVVSVFVGVFVVVDGGICVVIAVVVVLVIVVIVVVVLRRVLFFLL